MRKLLTIISVSILNVITSAFANEPPDYSDVLQKLLENDSISLTRAKLVIDHAVNPEINIVQTEQQIREFAAQARAMAGPGASSAQKVAALRTLIYKPGHWNRNTPFQYDFDNPTGRLAKDKTLSHYIETRKGNCVSMPLLFLAVAEQMGVEMNVTTAPLHMFIQYEDPDTGQLQHLETTSGADPQRLSWQRKVLPMTDRAIETGMYLKRMNRNEMIAVMADILLQDLLEKGDHRERIEVAALILQHHRQNSVGLLHLRSSYQALIHSEFLMKYSGYEDIPPEKRKTLDDWAAIAAQAEQMLHQLGWRPVKNIGTLQASFADIPAPEEMMPMTRVLRPDGPPNPMEHLRERYSRPMNTMGVSDPLQPFLPQMPTGPHLYGNRPPGPHFGNPPRTHPLPFGY